MGVCYNPKIVREGLVTHIDPANIKSYPGSGTTAYDISNNGKNGTLVNTTCDGTSFSFNGVNTTINFGAGSVFFPLYNFTFDLWFSSLGLTDTTGTSPGVFGGTYGIRSFVGSDTMNFGLDNGSSMTFITSPSGYDFFNGKWHQAVYQAKSTERKLYIDGELVGTLSDVWAGTTRWPTNGFGLGRDNNNSMYYFRGNMGPFKIYNRILTDNEIKQNFNAMRGRFGV